MKLRVYSISIPAASTLGFGKGVDCETERSVDFCGDHRAMRDVGELLRISDSPVEVSIEDWQVIGQTDGEGDSE